MNEHPGPWHAPEANHVSAADLEAAAVFCIKVFPLTLAGFMFHDVYRELDLIIAKFFQFKRK